MLIKLLRQFMEFSLIGQQTLLTTILTTSTGQPATDRQHLTIQRYHSLKGEIGRRRGMQRHHPGQQVPSCSKIACHHNTAQHSAKERRIALFTAYMSPSKANYALFQIGFFCQEAIEHSLLDLNLYITNLSCLLWLVFLLQPHNHGFASLGYLQIIQADLGIMKSLYHHGLQIRAERGLECGLQARRSNAKLGNRTNQACDRTCGSPEQCAYTIAIPTQALPPVFEHIQAIR